MSSKIGARFAKRQSQFKARGGYKRRTARTSINTIVKRALSSAGGMRPSMRRVGSASKEVGYVDVAFATYTMDTVGTAATSVTLLNTIAQGAGITQRVGKQVRMTSLQFRGLVFANSAGVINDVAYCIVYDKRPTGAKPAQTDILNAASSAAMNNDDNVPHRFQILKRGNFTLTGNSTTPATGSEAINADFYLPFRLPTIYKSAGTGAIGDIEEGALWFITMGNNGAGATAASMAGNFRLRFIDI